VELEAAKSEVQKWHSAFQNESFIPAGTNPGESYVVLVLLFICIVLNFD